MSEDEESERSSNTTKIETHCHESYDLARFRQKEVLTQQRLKHLAVKNRQKLVVVRKKF